jgi:ABC-2 type transport system permease protein
MSPLAAQAQAELRMTLKRGESLLLTLGIPVMLLTFFSVVDVLPTDADRSVDFLTPGILALAIMSTAMVSLAIATGFERQYGVLKRLGTTPLGRANLLLAKMAAIAVVELLQIVVLTAVGFALGWRPPASGLAVAAIAVVLGTAAFAGIGMTMAGTWSAEKTLAGANGLYLLLLLVSGMVIPLTKLPKAARLVARLLPSAALSDILHGALSANRTIPSQAWIVLSLWAIAMPVLAARMFRWE